MSNKDISGDERGEAASTPGIVFELDTFAFSGRGAMFEVCEGVLKEKKIKLPKTVFCRYCLWHQLNRGLAGLAAAEGRKISVEKLSKEIIKQYEERMIKKSTVPDKKAVSILSGAKEDGLALGGLSFLSEENASLLFERLELGESALLLAAKEGIGSPPTRDCWRKLAGKMGLNPRMCLALTTSAASCQAALAAGMRCVVVPDEFTEFQDFAGADKVVEGGGSLSLKELINMARARGGFLRM